MPRKFGNKWVQRKKHRTKRRPRSQGKITTLRWTSTRKNTLRKWSRTWKGNSKGPDWQQSPVPRRLPTKGSETTATVEIRPKRSKKTQVQPIKLRKKRHSKQTLAYELFTQSNQRKWFILCYFLHTKWTEAKLQQKEFGMDFLLGFIW